ncbi:MAG: hypothetical protein IKJ05_00900 [Oscillospiraceae bacterium]|nr:hypothetical protein [Oscillospiraceae bacterium]
MNTFTKNYFITLEGNDLDVKNVQKLKTGDSLKLGRVEDGEDTFEITVSTATDKMIDMLAYCDSIGVAPFMDDGSLSVQSATVDRVDVKQGKSRAKDKTTLHFTVEYSYDEEILSPFTQEGIFAFIPKDNAILAVGIYNVIYSGEDMLMRQPYLNMYDMQVKLTDEMKTVLPEVDIAKGGDFYAMILFDEKFENCKITAKITQGDDEFELELTEYEKQSVLTFVNHLRIFNGETPVDCVIE